MGENDDTKNSFEVTANEECGLNNAETAQFYREKKLYSKKNGIIQ